MEKINRQIVTDGYVSFPSGASGAADPRTIPPQISLINRLSAVIVGILCTLAWLLVCA